MTGSIYRRGNGWTVKIEQPRRADGRRQYRYQTVATRKEAERLRAKIVHEIGTGTFFEPTRMLLGEYLDKWLQQTGGGLSARTLERNRSIIVHHIKPALGSEPLAKLTPFHPELLHPFAR